MHGYWFLLSLCIMQAVAAPNYLTVDDFVAASKRQDKQLSAIDPLAQEGLVEGDIKMAAGTNRAALRAAQLWPNGIIPYEIANSITNTGRAEIAAAVLELQTKTCVKFQPRRTESDYVYFNATGGGCYSLVGRQRGRQTISIDLLCESKGIIVHEMLHAVGILHEQSRPDRDTYITVNWANVKAGSEDQFAKYSTYEVDTGSTTYDYGSIMHYGPKFFSKNGLDTITPKQNAQIGQREQMSSLDAYRVKQLYNCTTAGQRPQTVCSDLPESAASCASWKAQSWCTTTSYYNFMLLNCKQTCGWCPVVTSGAGVTGAADCRDTNSTSCQNLAMNYRACDDPQYDTFMTTNCRVTCNRCGTDSRKSSTCEDLDGSDTCANVYGRSECTSAKQENRDFMQRYCAKTCGTCVDPNQGICQDVDGAAACQSYGLQNCQQPLMKTFCAKSCGFCNDQSRRPTSTCKDDDADLTTKCIQITSYCNQPGYLDYMKRYCAFSCNLCGTTTSGSNSGSGSVVINASCKDEDGTSRCTNEYGLENCGAEKFKNYMQKYCAKSCGYCRA